MLSSGVVKGANNFLRKQRKWPFPPYKTKWHQTFNQDEALRILKGAAANSPLQSPTQTNAEEPYLLSVLVTSFKSHCCDPTPNAYYFVLKTLTRTSQFHHIPVVLDRLEGVEKFETPEYILTYLIKFYGQINKIHDAVSLFHRIPMFRCVPSAFSLNALLFALSKSGEGLVMIPEILLNSHQMGIRLEELTFRILITALCRMNKTGHAMEVLNHMINEGHGLSPRICSLVLSSLCEQKHSSGSEVLSFLEQMRKKGFRPVVADYSNVIKFFVRGGRGSDALDVLNKVKADGFKPDIVCYTMVLSGIIADGDYQMADELFDELLVLGLVPDNYTYNVYIHGLCKRGNTEAGIQMISRMEELGCKPDVITFNTLLETLCKSGKLDMARKLRYEMQLKGLAANIRTYRIMIAGLVNNGEVIEASALVEEMLKNRFPPPVSTFAVILSWFCERDMVTRALELLTLMVDNNFFPVSNAWEVLLRSSKVEFSVQKLDALLSESTDF